MKSVSLLLVAVIACGESAPDAQAAPGSRVPVATAVVIRGSIADVLAVPGRIDPIPGGRVVVASPAAGLVTRVRAQIGSRVVVGDTLLVVDVPDLAAQVVSLAATAAAARREADRLQALYDDGIAARRDLDQAQATARSAEAAAEAARIQVTRTRPVSPMAGVVEWVRVHAGEHVDAGQPLASVVRTDSVDFVAAVPAPVLSQIADGAVVTVTTDGAAPMSGRVVGRSPAVDSLSGAGRIVARVPNPARRLLPGSAANGTIRRGFRRAALIVPVEALVLVGDRLAVFIVNADSTVSARTVAVDVRDGGRVAVTGAITAGDRVVALGAYGLADGMRVVPRDSVP